MFPFAVISNRFQIVSSDPQDADTDDDGLGDATEITNCIYGENADK